MKDIKPRNYWNNKENCLEVSKTCNSRLEFKTKFRTAYKHCCKNKWTDEVCSHMKENLKPKHYWTKERCFDVAKKYNTIKEFRKNSVSAYTLCLRNKWLTDACSHMEKLGNLYMKVGYRMIFTSELNNNEYIYIGFTCDFKRRLYQHLNSKTDNLYNHIVENKLLYKNSIIYHDFLSAEKSKELEIKNIEFYKNEGNFIVLNIGKGGEGLRGKYELYTKEMCKTIFENCVSTSDAIFKNKIAYVKAQSKGWLKEIAQHIKTREYPSGYFTKKENCLKFSNLCETIKEFRKLYPRAYKVSLENNWISEFFKNKDEETKKRPKYWFDKNKCKNAANKCKNRNEFLNKYSAAYQNSSKNKWLDEFFPKK